MHMPTWLPIVLLLLIACSGIGRRAVPRKRQYQRRSSQNQQNNNK